MKSENFVYTFVSADPADRIAEILEVWLVLSLNAVRWLVNNNNKTQFSPAESRQKSKS